MTTKEKRPWGMMLTWALTGFYAGKILEIRRGKRLSLQFHRKKHESIYVLSGMCQVTLLAHSITAVSVLKKGQSIDIPAGQVHRFEAHKGPTTLVEVSTPELLDVVRLQDDHNRRLGC